MLCETNLKWHLGEVNRPRTRLAGGVAEIICATPPRSRTIHGRFTSQRHTKHINTHVFTTCLCDTWVQYYNAALDARGTDRTSYLLHDAAIAYETARVLMKPPDSTVGGLRVPESRVVMLFCLKNKLQMFETFCHSIFFRFLQHKFRDSNLTLRFTVSVLRCAHSTTTKVL